MVPVCRQPVVECPRLFLMLRHAVPFEGGLPSAIESVLKEAVARIRKRINATLLIVARQTEVESCRSIVAVSKVIQCVLHGWPGRSDSLVFDAGFRGTQHCIGKTSRSVDINTDFFDDGVGREMFE